jgi:nickel-dependent lactate racemase
MNKIGEKTDIEKNNTTKKVRLNAVELDKMAKQIEAENDKLVKTYKQIKADIHSNPHYNDVEESYKRYFYKKGADKQMRYNMLSETHKYLEQLKEHGELLKHIKQDQRMILEEMRKIKAEMKRIQV